MIHANAHTQTSTHCVLQMIRADPIKHMDPTLLANLCTLYEMTTSKAREKKSVVAHVVRLYAPDDFNIGVLKLD